MKYSLKQQLTFVFGLLIFGIVILLWGINAFFLEEIYSSEKKSNLMQAYDVLCEYEENGSLHSSEFTEEITKLCSINNINFIITDADSNTVNTSVNDADKFNALLRDVIFSRYAGTQKIVSETENYTISEIYDPESQMQYLTMWGILGNNSFFMLRTSMEGIHTNVQLASVFMFNVTIFVLLVAVITIHIVAKKITDPIMELADISQNMARLNFETRYKGKSSNEIAILGANFNSMLETLEKTIGDLKSANMKLKKDVKNREEIDEARKEFIANVSHELKTPIALIQGYAEGLQEGISDDPESRNYYCEVIVDETNKMNTLVKQLMTLGQMETGFDENHLERFDIYGVIKNCIQSDELLAKQKGIQVYMKNHAPVYVWADEFKIEQVFRNFFSNAVHHCEGEKQIRIWLEDLPEVVRIHIYNTGKQIPENALDHLWDKFYKVDKARTREYGGSGIGLSIVKAIMDSHHQKYGVLNHTDGVEFWFELSTQ